MSNVLTQNATKLAMPSFDTSNPDLVRLMEIVVNTSATKKGGMNFHAGTLFTKVCKTVKSLAGLPEAARLPDNVAGEIQRMIAELPENRIKNVRSEGYNFVKESPMKVKFNFRDVKVTETKSFLTERETLFDKQIAHITWELSVLKTRRAKLEDSLCDTAQAIVIRDTKLEKIEDKILRLEKLHRGIITERDYQQKQTVVNS